MYVIAEELFGKSGGEPGNSVRFIGFMLAWPQATVQIFWAMREKIKMSRSIRALTWVYVFIGLIFLSIKP